MPPVPSVRGERVVRALEKAGFKVARVAGSHHIMRHPDGRGTTVPVHQWFGTSARGWGVGHDVVATMQLSLLPGLARWGAAQIETVRVRADHSSSRR
jgi:predicted RNA binding protein YcfA (HicA-like mRNA interferase family)